MIHFLGHVIESIEILLKKVYLIDGTICKTYNDYVHGEDYGITGKPGFYSKKYVLPWASITKRVFNNKEKYKFMIVMYNNIPVAVY